MASILGNMIPFFPVPYLVFVVLVASSNTGLGLVPVATIAALGAAIGKFSSYALGYGAGTALSGSRARFDSFRKLLGGSAFLAAFIFAASPFPDDVIFIPLGVIRYSPIKTFISLFTGKFALTLFVAYVARTSRKELEALGGGGITSALSIILVVVISIIIAKVDWEKVLAKRQNGAFRRLAREVKQLLPRRRTDEDKAAGEASGQTTQ